MPQDINTDINTDRWQACPDGEIGRMVSRIRTGRRRQRLSQVAVATLTVALLAASVGYYTSTRLSGVRPQGPPGGIACEQVQAHRVGYLAAKLDPKTRSQIDRHLLECPACRAYYGDRQSKDGRRGLSGSVADNPRTAPVELRHVVAYAP